MAIKGTIDTGVSAGAGAGAGGVRVADSTSGRISPLLPSLALSLVPRDFDFSPTRMASDEREARVGALSPIVKDFSRLSPRVFGLAHADAFIAATKFEGGARIETAQYFSSILKSATSKGLLPESLLGDKIPQFAHFLTKLDQYIFWAGEIAKADTPDKRKSLSERIRDAALALREGETLTLPGGYSGRPGHAMMYQISRKADGKYAILVINTGDGAEHHSSIYSGYKQKMQPILRFENLTLEQLFVDRAHPKADYFYMMIYPVINPSEDSFEGTDIYFSLFRHFGKAEPGTHLQSEYITSQRSGTCAWKVLLAALRMDTNIDFYKRAVFYIKLISLMTYFEDSTTKLSEDTIERAQTRRMLRESAKNLLREASKEVGKDVVISEDEIKNGLALAETVLMKLDDAEKRIEAERSAKETKYALTVGAFSPLSKTTALRITDDLSPIVYQPSKSIHIYEPRSLSRPESFNGALQDCLSRVEKYTVANQIELAKEQAQSLIHLIPLPDEDSFYSSLTQEQAKELLKNAFTLFQAYVCLSPPSATRRFDSRERLTVIILYGAIYRLAKQYENFITDDSIPKIADMFLLNLNDENKYSGPETLFFERSDFEKFSRITNYYSRIVSRSKPYLHPFTDGIISTRLYDSFYESDSPLSAQSFLKILGRLLVPHLLRKFPEYSPVNVHDRSFSVETRAGVDLLMTHDGLWEGIGCAHLGMLKFVTYAISCFEQGRDSYLSGSRLFSCKVIEDQLGYSREKYISISALGAHDRYLEALIKEWTHYRAGPTYPYEKYSREDLPHSTRHRPKDVEVKTTGEAELMSHSQITSFIPCSVYSISHVDLMHSLIYERLKPIEMLYLASRYPTAFQSEEFRVAFFEQFFKSVVIDNKSVLPLEDALKDPLFSHAFIHFMQKIGATFEGDTSIGALNVKLFIYRMGIHLLPFLSAENPFYTSLIKQISGLKDLHRAEVPHSKYRYFIHLQYLLFLFYKKKALISPDGRDTEAAGAGAAGAGAVSVIRDDAFSRKEIEEILFHWIFALLNKEDNNEYNYVLKLVQECGYQFFAERTEIRELLTPEFLQAAIKEAVHLELDPAFPLVAVAGDHFAFASTDRLKTYIDVLKGVLFNTTGFIRAENLATILQRADFKDIFGSRQFDFTVEGKFAFFSDSAGKYRVYLTDERRGIERLVDGKWVRYLSRESLKLSYPLDISNGGSSTLPLSLLTEYVYWVGEKGLYFTHRKSGKVEYWIPTTGEIHAVEEKREGIIFKETLIQAAGSSLEPLVARFENPGFVLISRDLAGRMKLTLSRFVTEDQNPLRFLQTDAGWALEEDKNLVLVATYPKGLLHSFPSFLLLEDVKAKKQFALVPRIDYCTSELSPMPDLVGGGTLDIKDLNQSLLISNIHRFAEKNPLLSRHYSLIPIQDGDFAPLNPEQIAHVAYIKFGQKEYAAAFSFLKKITYIDLKEPKTRKFIEDLLKLASKAKDFSPQAAALCMRSHYLIAKAQQQEGLDREIDSKAYLDYLGTLANIEAPYQLSLLEELFVIESIKDINPRILRRKEILLGEKSALTVIDAAPFLTFPGVKVDMPDRFSISNLYLAYTIAPRLFFDADMRALDLYQILEGVWIDLRDTNERFSWFYALVARAKRTPLEKARVKSLFESAIAYMKTAKKFGIKKELLVYFYLSLIEEKDLPPLYPVWIASPSGMRYLDTHSRFRTTPEPQSEWMRLYKEQEAKATELLSFQMVHTPHSLVPKETKDLAPLYLTPVTYPKKRGEALLIPAFAAAEARMDWFAALDHYKKLVLERSTLSLPYGSELAREFPIEDVSRLIASHAPPEMVSAIHEECGRFVEGYHKLSASERTIASLHLAEMEEMGARLEKELTEAERILSAMKTKITDFANKQSPDLAHELFSSALTLSGNFTRLKMSDLVFLFLSKSPSAFSQANPALSADEITVLYNEIGKFLFASIHYYQMKRLYEKGREIAEGMRRSTLSRTDEIVSTESEREKHVNILQQLLELKMIALQGVEYDFTKHPEFLVFEHTAGVMFRVDPPQNEILEYMLGESPFARVAQVMMGGGKTTVIAANLLAKASLEGKIPILITPSFQYHSLYEALRKTMLKSFNIETLTFSYEREKLTQPVLDYILETFRSCMNGAQSRAPKVLVLCPEMLHILLLEFLALDQELFSYKGEPANRIPKTLLSKMETLRNILCLLKDHGCGLGDELHILLDIIKETYIPLGEPQSISFEYMQFVKSIFLLIDSERFSFSKEECAELGFSEEGEEPFHHSIKEIIALNKNRQAYFSTTLFKKHLAPRLAQKLARHPSLQLSDGSLHEGFIRYVTGAMSGKVQKALMLGREEYLRKYSRAEDALSAQDEHDLQFVYRLRKALFESSDPDAKEAAHLIAIAKYMCSEILPFVFTKTGNVNFGRTRSEEEKGKVVPYICADTPSTNEFGNHYEAMAYHMMTALIYGVTDAQIEAVFEKYHVEALWMAKNRGLPYEETAPATTCKELFGFLPSQYEGHKEEIAAHVKADPRKLLAIEEYTIEKYTRFHSERLNANAITLPHMLKVCDGFSGTLDLYTMDLSLQQAPKVDLEVNPRCVRALLEKNDAVMTTKAIDPKGFIAENFAKLPPEKRSRLSALLDLGGLFKDYDNTALAKEILSYLEETGSPIQAVVFFTRQSGSMTADYPALYVRGNDDLIILSDTTEAEIAKYGLRPGQYFSYYDKRHCTGTDIKQPADAIGLVTYDPTIPLDDATQGIMRFRGFLFGQRLHFVIPEFLLSSINSIRPADSTETLITTGANREALLSLVTQMMIVQVHQRTKKMVKAFQKMIINASFEAGKKALLEIPCTEANAADIIKLVEAFYHRFFIRSDDIPYINYGSLDESVDVIDSLRLTQQQVLSQLHKALQEAPLGVAEKDDLYNEVQREQDKIIAYATTIYSNFVQSVKHTVESFDGSVGEGTEIAMAREAQVETDQAEEKNLELEREIQQELEAYQQVGKILIPAIYSRTSPEALLKAFVESVSRNPEFISLDDKFEDDFRVHPYHKLFSSSLYFSKNFSIPYTTPINLLDYKALPCTHLLMVKVGDSYKGLIVSEEQALALKIYISSNKVSNAWVVLPNGVLQAGDQPSFDDLPEKSRQLLVEFSLLAGNTDYLMENLEDYLEWWEKQDAEPAAAGAGAGTSPIGIKELRKRFFILLYKRFAGERSQIYDYLLQPKKLYHLLELESKAGAHSAGMKGVEGTRDLSKIKGEAIKRLTPHEIRALSPRHRFSIRFLEGKEQIQALSKELIPFLEPHQIPLISPEQVPFLTKASQIEKLPVLLLNSAPAASLSKELMRLLTKEQIGGLTNPALLAKLEESQFVHVQPSMVPHLAIRSQAVFFSLSQAQLLKASPEQWARFTGEESAALKTFCLNLTNLELIALLKPSLIQYLRPTTIPTLPANETLLLSCTPDQLHHLSAAQISIIRTPALFQKIPYPVFKNCDPSLFRHMSPSQINALTRTDLEEMREYFNLDSISQDDLRMITNPVVVPVLRYPVFLDCSDQAIIHISQEQMRSIPFHLGQPQDRQFLSRIPNHRLPDLAAQLEGVDWVNSLNPEKVATIPFDILLPLLDLPGGDQLLAHIPRERISEIDDQNMIRRLPYPSFLTCAARAVPYISAEQLATLPLRNPQPHDIQFLSRLSEEQLLQLVPIFADVEWVHHVPREKLETLSREALDTLIAQRGGLAIIPNLPFARIGALELPRDAYLLPHLTFEQILDCPPALISQMPQGPWMVRLSPDQLAHQRFFSEMSLDQMVAFLNLGGNPRLLAQIPAEKIQGMNRSHITLLPHLTAEQATRLPTTLMNSLTREDLPAFQGNAAVMARVPFLLRNLGVGARAPQAPPVVSASAAAAAAAAMAAEQPRPQDMVPRAKYTQLLALHPSQLRYATLLQKIAYGVSMVAFTILGALFLIPVEITYLLAKCCYCHLMDPLHIGIWYVFKRFGQMITGAKERTQGAHI